MPDWIQGDTACHVRCHIAKIFRHIAVRSLMHRDGKDHWQGIDRYFLYNR
jgi:hypothetical protein